MIDGIKVQLKSADLKQHLENRAAHHETRAGHYQKEAKRFVDEEVPAEGLKSSNARNMADQMAQSAKTHQSKAFYYAFLAKNLLAGEVYLLTPHDLTHLELVPQVY